MAESAIEWTERVWNPVTGCDRISPGCAHCYALTLAKRLKKMHVIWLDELAAAADEAAATDTTDAAGDE